VTYTLVGPREIAPLEGKISVLSPVGKALVNHQEGETVEVSAPSGKLTYRIERIASL
jgi:transcription elongation GreA/GreB family factor